MTLETHAANLIFDEQDPQTYVDRMDEIAETMGAHSAAYKIFEEILDKNLRQKKPLHININDKEIIEDQLNQFNLLLGGNKDNIYKMAGNSATELIVDRIFDAGGKTDVIEIVSGDDNFEFGRFGDDLVIRWEGHDQNNLSVLCVSGFYLHNRHKIEVIRCNDREYDLIKLAELASIAPILLAISQNKSPQIRSEMLDYLSLQELTGVDAMLKLLQQAYQSKEEEFLRKFSTEESKFLEGIDIFSADSFFDLLPQISSNLQKYLMEQNLDMHSIYNNFKIDTYSYGNTMRDPIETYTDVELNFEQSFYEKCNQVISERESTSNVQSTYSSPSMAARIGSFVASILDSMSVMSSGVGDTGFSVLPDADFAKQINLASPTT